MSRPTPDAIFAASVSEHGRMLEKLEAAVAEPFDRLCRTCAASLADGGKILFFGNGGSASDAQHLATELVVRYGFNRPAMAAIALTTDTSLLTAAANDFSFDEIFARQIEALGRAGDVAIGISTSGNSPNVLRALEQARARGLTAAGFSGRNGGKMPRLADPLIVAPSDVTATIQEAHIMIGHALCDFLEQAAHGSGA